MQKKGPSRRSKSGQNLGKSVPVQLEGGTSASVNIGNIPQDQWTHCHGVAQSTGQQVNSLKIANVGQSTIIQDDSGYASSFDSNELEVAAIEFLNQRGYKTNYQGKTSG